MRDRQDQADPVELGVREPPEQVHQCIAGRRLEPEPLQKGRVGKRARRRPVGQDGPAAYYHRARSHRLDELEAGLVPRDSEDVDLDPESLAKIESLGYVAGSTHSADADADLSSLRDPKDMAGVLRDHYRAVGMVRRGQFERAIEVLEDLVRKSPESIDYYEDLGWSYSGLGRFAVAEQA